MLSFWKYIFVLNGWQLIFQSMVKILFHCLLICICSLSFFSGEVNCHSELLLLCNNMSFSPAAFKVFSLTLVSCSFTMIHLFVDFKKLCMGWQDFFDLLFIGFVNFIQWLFKYCPYPILLVFLSGTPITCMLDIIVCSMSVTF